MTHDIIAEHLEASHNTVDRGRKPMASGSDESTTQNHPGSWLLWSFLIWLSHLSLNWRQEEEPGKGELEMHDRDGGGKAVGEAPTYSHQHTLLGMTAKSVGQPSSSQSNQGLQRVLATGGHY